MDKCPACGSTDVHRSRTLNAGERLKKKFTEERPHRCHACGWRGWGEVRAAAADQAGKAADERLSAAAELDVPMKGTGSGVGGPASDPGIHLDVSGWPATGSLAPPDGNGRPAGGAAIAAVLGAQSVAQSGNGAEVTGEAGGILPAGERPAPHRHHRRHAHVPKPGLPHDRRASPAGSLPGRSSASSRAIGNSRRILAFLVTTFVLLAIAILLRACSAR
jgi:hypothetical protein